MASWWVEYGQAAANYLEDNGALVATLFFAIEALAESEGIPVDGAIVIGPNQYLFEVEEHQVVYERDEGRQIINVVIIKPN